MGLKVDISKMRSSLAALQVEVMATITSVVAETAEFAAEAAKSSTLYENKTGTLQASISSKLLSPTTAQVSASAPYARFVENGTQAHRITARNASVLRFEQNGVIRFAKSVWHPGTSPRPFMAEAKTTADAFFTYTMETALNNLFGSFNSK